MKRLITYLSWIFLLLMNTSSFALPTTSQSICEFNGINYKKALVFSQELRQALKSNNKDKIADMVSYPVRINISSKKHYFLKSKKEFIQSYQNIFNNKTKSNLFSYKAVFCNYTGAASGQGTIWFTDTGIFSINLE